LAPLCIRYAAAGAGIGLAALERLHLLIADEQTGLLGTTPSVDAGDNLRADHADPRVRAFAAVGCSELCDILRAKHRTDALGSAEIKERRKVRQAGQLRKFVSEDPDAPCCAFGKRWTADRRGQHGENAADPCMRQLGVAAVALQDYRSMRRRPIQPIANRES